MHEAKRYRWAVALLITLGYTGLTLALVAAAASGADAPAPRAPAPVRPDCVASKGEPPPSAEVRERAPELRYQPPRRGTPRQRMAGAVRRAVPALPTPLALVPDHVGETVSTRPSLFWHLDAAPSAPLELVFTLIEADATHPLVEAALPVPERAGIQRIRLADYGVELRPGVEYEWSVALVPDAARRANDVVSSGSIRRVAPPSELAGEPTAASTYAALGLWYDALESLSDGVEAAPADSALRGQREALLRQARLDAAVD